MIRSDARIEGSATFTQINSEPKLRVDYDIHDSKLHNGT